jgi:rhomboid protease GluP
LNFYNITGTSSATDKELKAALLDDGIVNWNKNIALINKLQELDLPELLKVRNQKMKEYCELRLKLYQLMYYTIDENTDKYNTEMDELNTKINYILEELKQ